MPTRTVPISCQHHGAARPRASTLLVAVALLSVTTSAHAQFSALRARLFEVNGRAIQEVRLGEEPGSLTGVRMVVLTNGPTAGTTTLLTAVRDANTLMDPATAPPTFTTVIPSGAVFSVGGPCVRGAQSDTPFIQDNRPKIMRVIGGVPSVITVQIPGSELYDSADCVVSGDSTRTFLIFTNRSLSRMSFYVDAGGANDLLNPQVVFSSIKTPFAGGLRPSMSIMPNQNRTVALMYMQTNGQSRWLQYNTETINIDFNCLAGTQTPPPTAFTIPRGGRVAGTSAVGDFNNDGVFDFINIDTSSPTACAAAPPVTPAGSVSAAGFNWTEPGAAGNTRTGLASFFYGQFLGRGRDGIAVSAPGAHAGNAGSFSVCTVRNSEASNAFLSVSVETITRLRMWQSIYAGEAYQELQKIFGSSIEEPVTVEQMFCRLWAL